MKIGIIGDTHFGAGYNLGKIDSATQLNSRLLDYKNTFNSIIDKHVAKGVKLIVLPGDIFETKHPTSAQLNTFSRCIKRAVNKGLEVVIAAGNHDQQRAISTTTLDIFNELELDNVTVYQNMGAHTILDGNRKINLFLMPYRDRRMIGSQANSEAIEVISGRLDALVDKEGGDLKIAIGHFMLDKSAGDDNPDTFSINELILPLSMFQNLDATIMGHVHRHNVLSKKDPVIMYVGSMEKVSFGEQLHKKVSIILDTDDINKFEVIKTRVRPLYDMIFDYTESNHRYKRTINQKIIEDIDAFNAKHNTRNTIVKFFAKVQEGDLYHVNHNFIREHILSKDVKYLASMQIVSVSSRQLRNKDITETVNTKEAFSSFISDQLETVSLKKKLLKYGAKIIKEVEGK